MPLLASQWGVQVKHEVATAVLTVHPNYCENTTVCVQRIAYRNVDREAAFPRPQRSAHIKLIKRARTKSMIKMKCVQRVVIAAAALSRVGQAIRAHERRYSRNVELALVRRQQRNETKRISGNGEHPTPN